MASNLVVQADNAVVDYTTITTLIQTVNSQQKDIDDLKNRLTVVPNAVDENGTDISSNVPGIQHLACGNVKLTSATVTVYFKSNFKTLVSCVGTVYGKGGTKAYASLKSYNNSQATFLIQGTTSNLTSLILHWVAIGTV